MLLSGASDSTTVLAIATREAGQRVHALSFSYGQRHVIELACAKRQAQRFDAVAHEIVDIAALGQLVRTREPAQRVAGSEPRGPERAGSRGSTRHPEHLRARAQHLVPELRAGLGRGPRRARHLARSQRCRLFWLPRLSAEFIAAFERMAALATKLRVEATAIEHADPCTADRSAQTRDHHVRGLSLGVDADTTSRYDPREHEGVSRSRVVAARAARCDARVFCRRACQTRTLHLDCTPSLGIRCDLEARAMKVKSKIKAGTGVLANNKDRSSGDDPGRVRKRARPSSDSKVRTSAMSINPHMLTWICKVHGGGAVVFPRGARLRLRHVQ